MVLLRDLPAAARVPRMRLDDLDFIVLIVLIAFFIGDFFFIVVVFFRDAPPRFAVVRDRFALLFFLPAFAMRPPSGCWWSYQNSTSDREKGRIS